MLGDQAPDDIDNRKRQLILTQFNRVLHEDVGLLLSRVQPHARHYIFICVMIIYQNTQIVLVAPAIQVVSFLQ